MLRDYFPSARTIDDLIPAAYAARVRIVLCTDLPPAIGRPLDRPGAIRLGRPEPGTPLSVVHAAGESPSC